MTSTTNLHFERTLELPVSAEEAFAWHARPGAFDRLTPPWLQTEIVQDSFGIDTGSRLIFRVRRGPLWIRWIAEHQDTVEGKRFTDLQIAGPFAYWRHVHAFEPTKIGAQLRDSVEYALPFGFLSHPVLGGFLGKDLDRMFGYRHRLTFEDLDLHRRYAHLPRLTVSIFGGPTWLARTAAAVFTTGGHEATTEAEVQIDLSLLAEKPPADFPQTPPKLVLLVLSSQSQKGDAEHRAKHWTKRFGEGLKILPVKSGEVISPAGGWLANKASWQAHLSSHRRRTLQPPTTWISIDDFAAGLLHLTLKSSDLKTRSLEECIELSASGLDSYFSETGFKLRHPDFVSTLEHFFA